MRTRAVLLALVGALLVLLATAGGATATPGDQHGPTTGHLIGSGEWGNIELLGVKRVTNTEGLVADVTVNPAGTYAFLANWGEPKCPENSEAGGTNNPDAGAWVIDISDLRNPRKVGFIPHSQDSRPGEGMQVVKITTPYFNGDVLVMNNEQCGKNGKGGVSLWNVTNPLKPYKLSEHFGDKPAGSRDSFDIHSAFAWDAGSKAYVVMTDNVEFPDVDVLDITKPNRPRLIAEYDLNLFDVDQPEIGLIDSFLHDMVVKKIDNHFIMLLSYWDGGYVKLNVDDPANAEFLGDTEYAEIDPLLFERTGAELTPEGNGHEAEFTLDNRYFIGTDEDFGPYRTGEFRITTGANAGVYPSVIVPGAAAPGILADKKLNGPVVYGGYGCPDSAPIPTPASIPGYLGSLAPGEEKIVVLQRGPSGDPSAPEEACFPGDKAHQAKLAGWDAVLFVARHIAGDPVPPFCGSGAFVEEIVGVCTTHTAYHKLFNQPVSFTYPDNPPLGTVGEDIQVDALFDGWGYVHLFDNETLEDLDQYAIPEGHDPAFASGHGDLTVHEVATDPDDADRAYLSYYAGGIRALQIVNDELVETGGYLDENGNNFWGVETFIKNGRTIILGSDRDSGLWIFRQTTD